MKHGIIVLILAVAVAAVAQTTGAPQQTPPSPPAGTQQTAPGTPGASGTQQTPPATPGTAATPGAKTPPQAKTQEEFTAYQQAVGKTSPQDTETAANEFATKFPQSELKSLLYLKAMREYQNMDNAEKTVEAGRKALASDPNSPEALVTVATVLSEKTRESDLDRDERLNEAVKDANLALQTIDTDLPVPPGAPPERVASVKTTLRAMAYAALGTVEMTRKNMPAAESNLRKSTEMPGIQQDPVTWLRLSVVLDQEKKYQDALAAADKAVEYSANMPQANNLAKIERDRLQKLVGAAGQPSTTPNTPATPATPASPAKPPR
ncbi:MAG: hypothetical protein ACR2IF_18865 [Terriglobales bacterium]